MTEWAHSTSYAQLLYPGENEDIEPGEIALAVMTGSDGIVLCGPRDQMRDRLRQFAAAIDNAPPVPSTEACIPIQLNPQRWRPGPLPRPLAPAAPAPARCGGATEPLATDPRMATCPQCISSWNNAEPHTRLSLSHPIPDLP